MLFIYKSTGFSLYVLYKEHLLKGRFSTIGGVVKCHMTTSSATSSSTAPSRIGMIYTVFATL
jgi:hypothetical protein